MAIEVEETRTMDVQVEPKRELATDEKGDARKPGLSPQEAAGRDAGAQADEPPAGG